MRYVTLGYGLGFFFSALLQNEVFPVPFSVFRFYMILSAAASCFFYHKMPVGVWPRYATKWDGRANGVGRQRAVKNGGAVRHGFRYCASEQVHQTADSEKGIDQYKKTPGAGFANSVGAAVSL